MTSPSKEISDLMTDYGFVIVRNRKHQIWRDVRGNQVVTPTSPSDFRVVKHVKTLLKKLNLKT